MLPLLKPDMIIIAKPIRQVSIGDVVIIYHNGLEKIKRIANLRTDEIYVLGDNLNASTDGRSFGWLPRSAILAKVIWPRV